MKSDFFSLLYTKNSECVRRNLFQGRNTVFVPDFFVLISWMSIFLPTIVLDLNIICILIFREEWIAMVALVICCSLHSICELFINTTALDKYGFSCHKAALFIIYFFGYGPVVICLKILAVNYKVWKTLVIDSQTFPFPIFYISSDNFSILKMFCFIYVALKCIPQIFILCILLVQKQFRGIHWFILTACILLNVVIFSQTMASLFPLRKTPAYYLNSGCVALNGITKYLATVCACCIQVLLFSMAFRELGYYAFLSHIILSFIWLWPCLQVLQSQPDLISKFQFGTYFTFFILIFTFIYIHPFERQGLIYYYIFYLINLMSEIYLLYSWCNPNTLEITYYFCLKIFFFGFLSCFGMVNFSLRFRLPESSIFTVSSLSNAPSKEEVGKRRSHKKDKNVFFLLSNIKITALKPM